jgi:hypothetical protein
MVQAKPPMFALNISASATGMKERLIVFTGSMGREPAKVAAVLKKFLLCMRRSLTLPLKLIKRYCN